MVFLKMVQIILAKLGRKSSPKLSHFVQKWEKCRFFVFEIFKDLNRSHRALRSSGPRERSFLAGSDALARRTGVHKGATPPRPHRNVRRGTVVWACERMGCVSVIFKSYYAQQGAVS